MKLLGKGIKITALLLALCTVIMAPGVLMEYESDRLMDKVSLYPIESVASEESSGKTMNIWERLMLINGAVTVVDSAKYTDLERHDPIMIEMEAQLERLSEKKVLPAVSLSGSKVASYTQRTYMAPIDPEQTVRIWVVCAQYETVSVVVYMDAETKAVYDVRLDAAENFLFQYDTDISAGGYFNYLCTFTQQEDIPDEAICIGSHYGEDLVYLSVILENIPEPQRATYRVVPAVE